MPGTWSELGIPPTTDTTVIRRAYAARLKTIRPDTDPHGFAALRTAYEDATARASRISLPDPPEPRPPASPEAMAPNPAPPEPAPPEPGTLTERLGRADPLAAAEWLLATRATGRLTLARDIQLADQLGWHLASDFSLPDDVVQATADRLGWPRENGAEPWARPLAARLAAAGWLATLHRESRSRWRWLGASHPVAARILLGRGRIAFMGAMSGDPTLRRRFGEYLLHAPVLAQMDQAGTPVLDPARIDSVRNHLAPAKRPWRIPAPPRWALWLGLILTVTLTAAWVIDRDVAFVLTFTVGFGLAIAFVAVAWIRAITILLRIVGRRFR